jgi:hypothetical protein
VSEVGGMGGGYLRVPVEGVGNREQPVVEFNVLLGRSKMIIKYKLIGHYDTYSYNYCICYLYKLFLI